MAGLFALMIWFSSGELSTEEWDARDRLAAEEEVEIARRVTEIIEAAYEPTQLERPGGLTRYELSGLAEQD